MSYSLKPWHPAKARMRLTGNPEQPARTLTCKLFGRILAIVEGNRRPLDTAASLNNRALYVCERMNGMRPNVARDLNNLAALLRDMNRLGEAEPIMRRAFMMVLKFTHETGSIHSDLKEFLKNYSALLEEMSLGDEETRNRLDQVGTDAGFDLPSYGELLGRLSPQSSLPKTQSC